MAITNQDIQAMRHRIKDSLSTPKRRKRRKVQRVMQEEQTLAGFIAGMM